MASDDVSSWLNALRFTPGDSLADRSTKKPQQFDGGKAEGKAALASLGEDLGEYQERLFASASAGGTQSVLLVVQGMDTAGKGGIMRHVVGHLDPQGVHIAAFKKPTAEELSHHFLWRIRKELPSPGMVGVFDRSHYEDVLIVRVHNLVPEAEWQGRYDEINAFEAEVAAAGTKIVKVMMHVSREEQGRRLAERLDRLDKHWKYNPGDIDERAYWPDYQDAYQALLDRTSTEVAPWFVVPADTKWFARLSVMHLLDDALRSLDLQWPLADFDVEAEKRRLADS